MPARASNTNVVQSVPSPAGAVGDDCTHVTTWDAANGGNLLGQQAISTNPDPIQLGDRLQTGIGTMVFTQREGAGETSFLSERKVRGAVEGGVWIQYHTGPPGADGMDNIITDIARTEVVAADFTITRF